MEKFTKLSGKEKLFLACTVLLLPTCIHFMLEVTSLVSQRLEEEAKDTSEMMREQHRHDLTHPRWSDFWISFIWALLISLLRFAIADTYLRQLGELFVANKPDRAARVNRFGGSLFKLLYFVFITSFGWAVLVQQNFMPSILGGSGHYREAWVDYPRIHVTWGLKYYYLLQMGYHLHELIFHIFIAEKRNDFMEMMLHHFIAMFLVILSYILNYIRPGSIVLFLHDVADVFVYASKTCVDTRYVVLTLSAYVGMLLSWGFARLYVLPTVVLHNVWFESWDLIHGNWVFLAMLLMLQCLHIYWYRLFLIMGMHFLKKGETVDMQQKISVTDDPEAAARLKALQQKSNGANGKHKNGNDTANSNSDSNLRARPAASSSSSH